MVKYFSSKVTWPKLLRFPLMFGGFLIFTGYGLLNFKQIFRKKIEAGQQENYRLGEELVQRSKDNKIKHNETSVPQKN